MMNYIALLLITVGINCKLEQVVSMFRHGARYHLNSYYDGNQTRPFWGELTSVGMRQHQNLGKMLRKDYIDSLNFLSNQYKDKSIEVYCTDLNRTLESVTSQLYGLYPLGFGPKKANVPQEYNIPPFSMGEDASQDVFALPQGYLPFVININNSIVMIRCDNRDALIKLNIDSQKDIFFQMYQTYLPFLRRMGQVFNISEKSMNFSTITSLYDTLTMDQFLGKPMPPDITEEDYYNMKHLHYWFFNFKISFDLSKSLNTGKLKRVISDFDGRISNAKQELKWTFLSAHDTDISAMLLDLNISSAQCIEQLYRYGKTDALNCDPDQQVASNIIFELHSQKNDYYIKIRHDGIYVNLCEKKNTFCLYEQWKNRVESILVDVDKVCNAKT